MWAWALKIAANISEVAVTVWRDRREIAKRLREWLAWDKGDEIVQHTENVEEIMEQIEEEGGE